MATKDLEELAQSLSDAKHKQRIEAEEALARRPKRMETKRIFTCPMCGIQHETSAKARRCGGPDKVVCKACQPLHHRVNRQKARKRNREEFEKNYYRLPSGNDNLPPIYRMGACADKEEALAEHRWRLGIEE